jgi:Kef-type K+ transport system membrane component KefB
MDAFTEIGLILALATAVAFFMQALRLPLILGHILTGVVAGPLVLNLIHSQETISIFSHLGITALLFIVGLGLSPHVMRDVGRVSLATGIGQIAFTTGFGYLIGRAFGFDALTSLTLAVAFTFSSTIIISKLLSDRGDAGKLYGKIAIGFLIVQDLAATAILITLSALLQGGSIQELVRELSGALFLTIGLVILFSRFLLPKLTRFFASSQEFLFLFAVGWGVGMAALFHKVGLSIEIGALIAGVTLASSPYHYEISAKMKLLRDFFIIMFFILLGSRLEFASVVQHIVPAVIFSLFILVGNPLIVMAIMGVMGYTKKTGFYAGLTVAQISEFSLLMILLVTNAGYLSSDILALATVVGIVTITVSTLMILHADALYRFFAPILGVFERRKTLRERSKKERYDAILFGCHRVGEDFLPSLDRLKLKYLVVDYDPEVIERLTKKGIPARYGDADDNEFLDELDFSKLKMLISTMPDIDTNILLLTKLNRGNLSAAGIFTAHGIAEANLLYENDADYVILPHFLGGNYAAMLTEKFGTNKERFAIEKKKHLAHLARRAEGSP